MFCFQCGAVAFQAKADMVSSDVVGYDTVGLLSGGQAKGVGASFFNVNGSDLTLGDLTVTGYDTTEGYAEFEVQVQQLDGFGRTLGGMTYYWADFTDEGVTYKGWFDGDGNNYDTLSLVAGEGLWIYSPSTNFKVQSAGAVPSTDVSVVLRANGQAKMVVNPMPTKLTLGDITVAGYNTDDGYAEFEVQVQQLDGFGRTLGGMTYYWVDFTDEGVAYYGWYDSDGNEYNDLEVAAGEGLWIYSPSTSFSVVFPSPPMNE